MSFIYTPQDVRKAMEADGAHGTKWAFVLKEFDKRGFSLTVENLGFIFSWKLSDRGVVVDTGASDIATAARWARNGFRQWAYRGIQEPNIYFAEIARAWAISRKDSCTQCLGSAVDFLYLFSAATAESDVSVVSAGTMYVINSLKLRDLKGILLWIFAGWWEIKYLHDAPQAPVATDQSDLHDDYHDSQRNNYKEDQTHHFAFYFYVGATIGSHIELLRPFLKQTDDIDATGKVITNPGDYYLGLTAARLGDDFEDNPRFMGAEIAGTLQRNSPDKLEDMRIESEKKQANLWIDEDGEVVDPGAPAGNGGPGRFASARSLLSVPEPGGLPHPNSPAARTLDPLKIYRYARLVEEGLG